MIARIQSSLFNLSIHSHRRSSFHRLIGLRALNRSIDCFKVSSICHLSLFIRPSATMPSVHIDNDMDATKPPNLLILTEDAAIFEEAKSRLTRTGFSESYCVYRLKKEDAKSGLWLKNCRLLIIVDEALVEESAVRSSVDGFVSAKGSVLSFGHSLFQTLDKSSSSEAPSTLSAVGFHKIFDSVVRQFVPTLPDAFPLVDEKISPKLPLIQCRETSTNMIVVSGISLLLPSGDNDIESHHAEILSLILEKCFGLERKRNDSTLMWTSIYVKGADSSAFDAFKGVLEDLNNRGRLGNLCLHTNESQSNDSPRDQIPVLFDIDCPSFDAKSFFHHLRTRYLAKVLLYADILPTTMTILDPISPHLPASQNHAIVVASRQSSGLGRGGNAWLSPPGCAMFTLNLPLSLNTELGSRISIVQHLVALAVVEATVGRKGYESVDARIKWPNDLVHGETRAKLGGVLVKTSIMGKDVRCVIGCGVNLDNGKPTTCLNDLAREKKIISGDNDVSLMSKEEFIARVVSQLETVLSDFKNPLKRSLVMDRYYQRWIHSDQKVTIDVDGSHGCPMEAIVVGIDEFGFLRARTDDGKELTLHPDGNSFDLFRNLIVSK